MEEGVCYTNNEGLHYTWVLCSITHSAFAHKGRKLELYFNILFYFLEICIPITPSVYKLYNGQNKFSNKDKACALTFMEKVVHAIHVAAAMHISRQVIYDLKYAAAILPPGTTRSWNVSLALHA